MNIEFKKIIIDNFRSVEHIELDLDNKGTILVRGINNFEEFATSNGSGKSTITSESILWCLTGVTNNKSKTINNNKTNGIAKVKLLFNIDNNQYELERVNDTTKSLNIIKNGQNISGNTYTKSKEILDKELGFINEQIVSSIIVLGQGMKYRFSNLQPSERKNCLEYFIGIDSLLLNIQTKLENSEKTINDNITKINLSISEQNTIITTSKEILNSNNNLVLNETEYQENLAKYNELNTHKDELTNNINNIKDQIQKILLEKDSYNTKLLNYNNIIHSNTAIITNYNNNKTNITNSINEINKNIDLANKSECPTCHQTLHDNKLLTELNNKLAEKQNQLKELEKTNIDEVQNVINNTQIELNNINTEINKLQTKINENNSTIIGLQTDLNNVIIEFNKYKQYIDNYEKLKIEQKSLEEVKNKAQTNIDNANKELTELNKQLNKLIKDKDIHKFFKSQVSRKFRNFLLEGAFTYINTKLKEYSERLYKDRVVTIKNNNSNIDICLDDLYYEDLSGGEQRKCDLCIQFVLRNLAKNQRNLTCNLLTIDEAFDYLDLKGIEVMTKFIQEETTDVSTLFITTHMENITIDYDKILEVSLNDKGISTLTEIE